MTGSLGFWNTFLPQEYTPEVGLLDKLKAFAFSKKLTQYFCGDCGAHVIEKSISVENGVTKTNYGIMPGTLERFDGVCSIQHHIYIGDTVDGGLADWLPTWRDEQIKRYVRYNTEEVTVPMYWHAEQVSQARCDKVEASCKCRGVRFWIHRPQENDSVTLSDTPPQVLEADGVCSPVLGDWTRGKKGKFLVGHCICDSCRLGSGHEITSWIDVRPSDLTLDAEGHIRFSLPFGTLKSYESSPGRTRSFCSGCGSRIFFQSVDRHDSIDVTVGILHAAEGSRASTWLDWQLHRVGFREDGIDRASSVLSAFESGLHNFVEHAKQVGAA